MGGGPGSVCWSVWWVGWVGRKLQRRGCGKIYIYKKSEAAIVALKHLHVALELRVEFVTFGCGSVARGRREEKEEE